MKTDTLTDILNVGIYCRLSRDDGNSNDESASISHQKDMLIKYVLEKGWDLKKIYVDDGFTGTNFQRPDFKMMIADIESGLINCVITKDLSRLGRDRLEVGRYTENYFPEKGVRYIAVNDNIDTFGDNNDIAPFIGIFAEMYAKDISRKTRSAKKTLMENGKFANSRAPYGYMKSPLDKHVLIIDENVADNVKRIYQMFLSGKSGRLIADIFNREGILTPNSYYYECLKKPNPHKNQSNKWGSGTILGIIKNPVYKGTMAQGKRRMLSFKSEKTIKNPSDLWIIVEDTHEPIISKDIWKQAQKLAEKNHLGIRRGGNGEVSLFSGVAKCGSCGTKMTFNRKIYAAYTKEYYRCGRYTNKGTNACKPHTITQDKIYMAVTDDIRQYAKLAYSNENQLIQRLIKSNQQQADKDNKRHEKRIREKENRLIEIDSHIQSLFEEKIIGNVPENIFKRMAQKYDDEQLTLSKEIEILKIQLADLRRDEADIMNWVEKIKKCLSIEELTREIIVELIDKIEISEVYEFDGKQQQDINITYRFENLSDKAKTSKAKRAGVSREPCKRYNLLKICQCFLYSIMRAMQECNPTLAVAIR